MVLAEINNSAQPASVEPEVVVTKAALRPTATSKQPRASTRLRSGSNAKKGHSHQRSLSISEMEVDETDAVAGGRSAEELGEDRRGSTGDALVLGLRETIAAQGRMLGEREVEVARQGKLLEERDAEIVPQSKMADDRETEIKGLKEANGKLREESRELKELLAAAEQNLKLLEQEATQLRAERDFINASLSSSQALVMHHQSELDVLRDAVDAKTADLDEVLKAREFAEVEGQTARTCFRELEKDKLVQDGRIETLKTENSLLREELGTTRQDLSDSLARESRHEEESKILLSALEKLEAAEAVRAMQGGESDSESIVRREPVAEDDESEAASGDEEQAVGAPNTTMGEYDVIDLRRELSTPSEVSAPTSLTLKARFQALVNPGRNRSHPSSHAVKLFAVREIEDDLADLRQLLASLCDDFANTDPAKGKRLQRLQEQIEVCMDTIRINATKLKAVRAFAK